MTETLPNKNTITAASALSTVASLLWLPQAALLAVCVGRMAAGSADVFLPVVVFLLLRLLQAGVQALSERLAFRGARAELSRLRLRVATALAEHPPFDAARPSSGLAASALAEQAELIVPYLSRFRPARFRATVVPVAIFLAIFPLSWLAALALLIALPVIPLFMALIGWRAKAASEAHLGAVGTFNGFLLDRLRGMATIRGLGAVGGAEARLATMAGDLRDRTMAVLRIAFLSSAVLELFSALGVAMVAVYVGFHLLGELPFGAWGARLSLTEGMFILLLAPAFFEPMRDLAAVWHDRASGEAAFDALDGLVPSGMTYAGALARPSRTGEAEPPSVMLEAAQPARENGRPVSFSVGAGEHVALTGPSGSGKSTAIGLIAGLVPLVSGRVLVGGVPMAGDAAATLRAGMAWLGQEPHLLPLSLAENVRAGRDISDEDLAAALSLAGLSRVAALRGGVPLGEDGAGLSGGEAMRLALARAAASPSGLILADEPTAHLDSVTANAVMEGLLTLARGRTLIVATHDPRLIARLDRAIAVSPSTTVVAA
ncbi:ABC transporter ATP-binding protein [Haematobacter massiliensis]|uniref:ABC transporter ATP-binding protein n=1 Tax=Haematobacter massiliensis TaxID=195105 RepID=A0A086Y343_9RHOB|nr:thiol reductant ABC exporter subunit CydD [Haematobacter massiliensis]KFI28693.1 ABC transporter ATP-binding protein [Haematobacter massiliensis]OWJ88624.1 thiol reductant ABC exporter subunit CydD [Haematobacter massiliensis]